MTDDYHNVSLKESATRRDFIHIATGAVAAVGVGALAWPMVAHMNPARDNLIPPPGLDFDISTLREGEQLKVLWYGKPVFIRHRTQEEIQTARAVSMGNLTHPETDDERLRPDSDGNLKPQYLVIIGLCPHFGCVPVGEQGDFGGWYCPCHGAHFDTSGRVRKGPPPINMEIPPYEYVSDTVIRLHHPHYALMQEVGRRIY